MAFAMSSEAMACASSRANLSLRASAKRGLAPFGGVRGGVRAPLREAKGGARKMAGSKRCETRAEAGEQPPAWMQPGGSDQASTSTPPQTAPTPPPAYGSPAPGSGSAIPSYIQRRAPPPPPDMGFSIPGGPPAREQAVPETPPPVPPVAPAVPVPPQVSVANTTYAPPVPPVAPTPAPTPARTPAYSKQDMYSTQAVVPPPAEFPYPYPAAAAPAPPPPAAAALPAAAPAYPAATPGYQAAPVPDLASVFDADSPVLTTAEIERAIALETAQLAQAHAMELARLQAEAQAEVVRLQAEAAAAAIRAEREAASEAKRKEEIFLKTIPEQVRKDPWDHVKQTMGGGNNLFFTVPERLVVGNPARVYVNKQRSDALRGKHNVRLFAGFNDWKIGKWDTAMIPVGSDADDYAYSEFNVPDLAYGMNFVFEADGQFENSGGDNFFLVSLSQSPHSAD
jgi:hypothetical protein